MSGTQAFSDSRASSLGALPRSLYTTGMLVKHPDMEFDPKYPYRACMICGQVFQPPFFRQDHPTATQVLQCEELKANWAKRHSKSHPDHEHLSLIRSGRMCTPEAAQVLCNFGLIPITDLVTDDEVAHALATAPRIAQDDAEG